MPSGSTSEVDASALAISAPAISGAKEGKKRWTMMIVLGHATVHLRLTASVTPELGEGLEIPLGIGAEVEVEDDDQMGKLVSSKKGKADAG